MPLKPGTSNKTRNENIREMVHAGYPVKRAVAAGYAKQRESKAKARKKK